MQYIFFSTCNKKISTRLLWQSVISQIPSLPYSGWQLISRLWEQRNKKQTPHFGFFTCVLCITPSGIKFRALVGSRHHFGTFISMALLIQFTVGRLVHCLFFSLLEQIFWLHFHSCSILNPINAISSVQSQTAHVISSSFYLNILIMQPIYSRMQCWSVPFTTIS